MATSKHRIRYTPEIFMSRVEKDEHGCWLWLGTLFSTGYGKLCYAGKQNRSAHRLSWELNRGPIPDGLSVLHKCDVARCINPDHLFLGTHLDNMRDAREKGRLVWPTASGERSHSSRLNFAKALEIRDLYRAGGVTYRDIANKFQVSIPTIGVVLANKRWAVAS